MFVKSFIFGLFKLDQISLRLTSFKANEINLIMKKNSMWCLPTGERLSRYMVGGFKRASIIMVLCSLFVLTMCSSENLPDEEKLSLLYLEQSKISWDGASNNYFIDICQSQNGDTTLALGLGLYRNHGSKIEDVVVDLLVDVDSLNSAIELSTTNDTYSLYKKAKLLPSEYYSVPGHMALEGGKDKSGVSIVIKKSALLKDPHTTKEGAIYIIPLKIANPTRYRLNPAVSSVMCILRFPGSQLDPEKPDATNPGDIEGYNLVWNDEFNGQGAPDASKWNFERGFVRNQELQWYTPDNAVCGEGVLTIFGKKERVKNPYYEAGSSDWKKNREYAEYTATSMTTHGKMQFKFGRIVVRAKIPTASGAWPAIWTLGQDGEWPSCGEIDILEYYKVGNESYIHANFAWGTSQRWTAKWDSWKRPFSEFVAQDHNWKDKFHVWMMDWEEDKTYIYLDGVLIREVWTNSMWNGGYDGNWGNPFHQPHYVLLNLALGSNGGTPDGSAFPMKYEIDYVRVYQRNK